MPPPYTTPGEAIADRLSGATAAGVKVYPQEPTQDPTVPWIVYRKVSGAGGKRLNGRNSLQTYSFRVDCYATDQAPAEALLAQVIARLTTWEDRTNGVHGCFDSEDQDDDTAEDTGGGRYRVAGQTFDLMFRSV